jgi:hypothetical protein
MDLKLVNIGFGLGCGGIGEINPEIKSCGGEDRDETSYRHWMGVITACSVS